MKKVMVLGASGMLGSMVATVLSREQDIELTLTEMNPAIRNKLASFFPQARIIPLLADRPDSKCFKGQQWIINAIGIIKQKMDEANPAHCEMAININTVFPHWLGQEADQMGARVIQIATDCVFSGSKGGYLETDPHDPHDVYGKTKSLGEVNLPSMTHLRTSIIGPEAMARKSLLEWFLCRSHGEQITGFTNHLWNGITTLHFAKICLAIIRSENLELPTIQHITAIKSVSKYEMLKAFAKNYQRNDIIIHKGRADKDIDRTLNTARPDINQQLWNLAGYDQPPTVDEMIQELSQYQYSLKLD